MDFEMFLEVVMFFQYAFVAIYLLMWKMSLSVLILYS